MSLTRRVENQWLGIGLYLAALVSVVLISVIVKTTSDRIPVQQALLFRFSLCLIPLLLMAKLSNEHIPFRTPRIRDYLIRSICGITSIGLFFVAVGLIPLATATAIAYSAPIFCVVLSIPLLGEVIGIRRWTAVVIGFIGVLIVSWPGKEVLHIGSIAALVSAIGGAVVVIYLRKLSDTESPIKTSLFYNAFGAIVFFIWSFSVGWQWISKEDMVWMVALGLLAGIQQYCFASAFRYGEATFLAPFEYLALVLAAIAGYYWWNETPSIETWIGGVIISCAGLFMLQRRSSLAKAAG